MRNQQLCFTKTVKQTVKCYRKLCLMSGRWATRFMLKQITLPREYLQKEWGQAAPFIFPKQPELNWTCSHRLPQLQDRAEELTGGIWLVGQTGAPDPHLPEGSETCPWHAYRTTAGWRWGSWCTRELGLCLLDWGGTRLSFSSQPLAPPPL